MQAHLCNNQNLNNVLSEPSDFDWVMGVPGWGGCASAEIFVPGPDPIPSVHPLSVVYLV